MLRTVQLALALVCLGALALSTGRADELKKGDEAPKFEATDDQGNTWKSSDHVGKKILVVYFYPGDFTGGCTKQACAFRDDNKTLSDKDVEVIGISGDTAKIHGLFKKEYKLPFTLLSDEKGDVAKKFGLMAGKGGKAKIKVDGKDTEEFDRPATIGRWTFVIGKDGKVVSAIKVDAPAKDSQRVLEEIEKLKK